MAETLDVAPLPTVLPLWSTPLPLIDTLCDSDDGFAIVIVTLPALALSLFVSNLSWLASALILSALAPPADPPDAAGVEP